jgi:hypothetical protein
VLFNFPENSFPEYAWPGHEAGGPFFPKRAFPDWVWPKTGIREVRSIALEQPIELQRDFILDDDDEVIEILAHMMRAINA